MGISYSVETDPDRTAKAMVREQPVSLKHSKAVAAAIKGETVATARDRLTAVKRGDQSIPFKQHNSGVGHRSDLDGWDAGRYPEQAAELFLTLLENVANNAEQQGFDADAMEIVHVAPHKVGEREGTQPRARGRSTAWNTVEIDVEIVVAEPESEEGEA